jgi:hypothetical protein
MVTEFLTPPSTPLNATFIDQMPEITLKCLQRSANRNPDFTNPYPD